MITWIPRGAGGGVGLLAVALSVGCAEDSIQDNEGSLGVAVRDAAVDDRDAGMDEVRTAPEPERLSAEQVRQELAELPPDREMGVRDFQRFLRTVPAAQTPLALQWTLAHAANIAQDRPGRSSQAFLRRLARAVEKALVGPGFSTEFQQAAECHVGFDNPESLAALPDAAQNTFTQDPHYFEPCRTGFIRFEPLNYGHYHLIYEDPSVTCMDENGLLGRGEPGDCVAVEDPPNEPRRIGAHHGSQVIRIRYHTGGGLDFPLPFALRYFINVGGEPVKIRFRTTDDEWFGWNHLAGQTVWVLWPHAMDIEEMLLTHADTALDCGPDWGFTTGGSVCPTGGPPFFVDHFAIEP